MEVNAKEERVWFFLRTNVGQSGWYKACKDIQKKMANKENSN